MVFRPRKCNFRSVCASGVDCRTTTTSEDEEGLPPRKKRRKTRSAAAVSTNKKNDLSKPDNNGDKDNVQSQKRVKSRGRLRKGKKESGSKTQWKGRGGGQKESQGKENDVTSETRSVPVYVWINV